MARRDSDQDRSFVDRHGPETVPQDDPLRTEAFSSRSFEVGEDAARQREVGFVLERGDPPARRRVRTDPAGEHHDAAQPRSLEGPHRRVEGESPAREPNAHP
jgi:hypothetical protein